MKNKNQILSYFVAPHYGKNDETKVFLSPVTMNSTVGKKLIELQTGIKSSPGNKFLQVCLDMESKRLYIPNACDFTKNTTISMLESAKKRIKEDFKDIEICKEETIEGSPFSSLRIRSVESFSYSKDVIQKHFGGKFENLTVIEANLAKMPTTVKMLPCIYKNNKNFIGGYVHLEEDRQITFFDEIDIRGKTKKEVLPIHTQKTSFILIDISPIFNPSSPEKEWAVLSGYRDYLYKNNGDNSFADIYAIKHHLYLGWTFEEICSLFLKSVNDFGELIKGIQLLVMAAKTLKEEGYEDPSINSYFLGFKIDKKTFPLNLSSVMKDGMFDPFKQINAFQIVELDMDNQFIIIETPAFISQELCLKILKAKSRPIICRYNNSMNTIDVKSQSGSFKELKDTNYIKRIKDLILTEVGKNYPKKQDLDKVEFRDDERAKSISLAGNVCHIRKLSEYHYACDHIKKMCKKRGMEFKDIDVVVGPLERIFGRGVLGGFMGEKQFIDSKMKIPHQITKGLFVKPPIMAVDSVTMPSYAKQTETLIHEYSHNLYSMTNPNHEHLYNKDKKLRNSNNLKYWDLYLNDQDERLAHKEEIKYQILSGTSIDEIIRDKVGGKIDESNMSSNYPIALEFKKLVEEAVLELEKGE